MGPPTPRDADPRCRPAGKGSPFYVPPFLHAFGSAVSLNTTGTTTYTAEQGKGLRVPQVRVCIHESDLAPEERRGFRAPAPPSPRTGVAFVLATVAIGLVRILRGPSEADRIMAAQLLGTDDTADKRRRRALDRPARA